MMKRTEFFMRIVACLTLFMAGLSGQLLAAEQLDDLDSWTAQEYAQYLVEKFAEVKDKQIVVAADADEAIGLAAGREGIILVPVEGLNEGEEDAGLHTEKGSGLACLFLSPRFNPIVDGKQIPQEKLLSVKYMDDDGDEKLATCLLLAVRNVEGDDWRLYAYGKDAKPVVEAQFEMAEEEGEGPIAIAATDAGEKEATLVVTLFGKYVANFKIGQ